MPVVDGPGSQKAVDVGCRLAAEHGASIVALAVIEIPPLLPLDAHMTEEEAEARQVLAGASAIGDSYGVTVSGRIVRAREASAAIVEQVGTCAIELIVIGAPRARRRHAVFGKTIEHVLKQVPCRVMVVAAPEAAPVGASAAA